MKRCPECGNISEDAASFCPACGRYLSDVPEAPQTQAPVYYQSPSRPSRRPRVPISTIVAVSAVVIILVSVAFSATLMKTDDGKYDDCDRTVTWSVPSIGTKQFSVRFTVTGGEMDAAAASSVDRSGSSTNLSDHASGRYAVKDYVVIGDAVKSLSQKLWDKFHSEAGAGYHEAKYFADFVLAFVQAAAEYALDSDKFGQEEYWQFPVEVLYRGYGDCEDTSILASALFNHLSVIDGAKDYIECASVFLLPGHAMVGVDVRGGIPIAVGELYYGVENTADHHMHYFGETTISDPCSYVYNNPPEPSSKNWYYVGAVSAAYMSVSVTMFTGTSSVYV